MTRRRKVKHEPLKRSEVARAAISFQRNKRLVDAGETFRSQYAPAKRKPKRTSR